MTDFSFIEMYARFTDLAQFDVCQISHEIDICQIKHYMPDWAQVVICVKFKHKLSMYRVGQSITGHIFTTGLYVSDLAHVDVADGWLTLIND